MAATRSALRTWLPRGNTLDAEAFAERHLLLRVVLALHVPALAAFTLVRGATPLGAAAAVILPAVCVVAASVFGSRRAQALFVTAGLLWCSAALVHLSGGMVEAHFHFFIVVGLVALYQDWPPFLFAIGFSIVSNGAAGFVDPGSVYNHPSGQANPLLWALVEGVALVAASATQVLFWRATERSQAKAAALAGELVHAEEQSARRASVSELFVNLARRNQSLLDRQLALIDDLEQVERDPDALAELFKLDHLATRIRRNAESLLVLSGEEPARRWGAPVPLSEVARAAVAEVEDFNRAEILVDEGVAVSGRAVADLAHLLAELIENATTFSPPTMPVQIRGRRTNDGRCLMTVEDRGIGMGEVELAAVNARLAAPPDADVDLDRRLGFRVVGRLAARYGARVALTATSGGGITAIVEIPAELVAAPRGSAVGATPDAPATGGPASGGATTISRPTASRAPVGAPAPAFAASPAPATPAPAQTADRVTPEPAAALVPAAAPTSQATPSPVSAPLPAGPVARLAPAAATPEPVAALPSDEPADEGAPVPAPLPTRQPGAVMAASAPATEEPDDERTDGAVPTPLPTRQPGAALAGDQTATPAPAPAPAQASAPAGVALPKRTPGGIAWPTPPQPTVPDGLPARVPTAAGPGANGAGPAPTRSPEQARLLLSRFQSGQSAGRSAADARRDAAADTRRDAVVGATPDGLTPTPANQASIFEKEER